MFIQLGQEPITADRVGASIAKPGRSGRSFAINFILIFSFFRMLININWRSQTMQFSIDD